MINIIMQVMDIWISLPMSIILEFQVKKISTDHGGAIIIVNMVLEITTLPPAS